MRATALVLLVAFSLVAGYALRDYMTPAESTASSVRSYRPPPVQASGPTVQPPATESTEIPAAQPTPGFAELREQATIFDTLHLAYRLAADAELPELERYTLEALSYEDSLYRLHVADVFLMRMNAIDVNASLDLLEGLPDSENKRQLLTSMVTIWARKDADAAGAYADSITNPRLRRMVAYAFARDTSLPNELRAMDGAFVMGANGIVVNAPDIAGAVMYQGDQQLFAKALSGLQQNPEQTMDALMAREDTANKSMLLQVALGRLASIDPELALSYADQYPEEFPNGERTVLGMMAQTDSSAQARERVEDYAQRTGDPGPLGQMLSSWMRRDPEAALAYYEGMPDQFRMNVASQVGMEYIQMDPEAGLDWLVRETGDTGMVGVAISIGGEPVMRKAEAMLNEMPDGEQRRHLIQALATQKMGNNPESAISWLAQYEDEPGYEAAYGNVINNWAHRDPAAAATMLEQGPDLRDTGAYSSLGYAWGQQNPDAAIAWGEGLADPEAQAQFLAGVAAMVGQYDQERARRIFFEMPDGDVRNRLGAELAARRAGNNFAAIREEMEELGLSDQFIDDQLMLWQGPEYTR